VVPAPEEQKEEVDEYDAEPFVMMQPVERATRRRTRRSPSPTTIGEAVASSLRRAARVPSRSPTGVSARAEITTLFDIIDKAETTNQELVQRIHHLRDTRPILLGHTKYQNTLLTMLLHSIVYKRITVNREPVALKLLATGYAKPEYHSTVGSALMLACECKYVKLANILLDVLPPSEYGKPSINKHKTPLMLAIEAGIESLAVRLIESGQSHPEISDSIYGNTALIMACEKKMPAIASLLIHTGHSDPGHVNRDPMDTALIVACKSDMVQTVLELLETGQSNSKHANIFGNTALIISVKRRHQELTQILLDPAVSDLSRTDKDGETALYKLMNHYLNRPYNDESLKLFRAQCLVHFENRLFSSQEKVIEALCRLNGTYSNPKIKMFYIRCTEYPEFYEYLNSMCTPPVPTQARYVKTSPQLMTARRKLKLEDLQRSMVRRTRKKTPPRAERVMVDMTARPLTPETFISIDHRRGQRMPKRHSGNDYSDVPQATAYHPQSRRQP